MKMNAIDLQSSTRPNSPDRITKLARYDARVFGSFCLMLTLCAQAGEHATPIEKWQDFTSNPPNIKSLIFEEVATDLDNPQPEAARMRLLYLMKWQPNGFYLRQMRQMEELEGGTNAIVRASGRFDDFYWCYTDVRGLEVYDRSSNPLIEKETNGVFATVKSDMDYCSWVLNLGAPNHDIGSLTWHDGSFTRTNRAGIIWEGQLLQERERPTELFLKSVNPVTSLRCSSRAVFSYDDPPCGPFLPSTLSYLQLVKSNWIPMIAFRIHSIDTSEDPLPATDFMFAQEQLANKRTIVYSNDMAMLWVKDRFLPIAFHAARAKEKHTLLLVWLLVATLGPAGFLIFQRRFVLRSEKLR
jgi:hypothetical protein